MKIIFIHKLVYLIVYLIFILLCNLTQEFHLMEFTCFIKRFGEKMKSHLHHKKGEKHPLEDHLFIQSSKKDRTLFNMPAHVWLLAPENQTEAFLANHDYLSNKLWFQRTPKLPREDSPLSSYALILTAFIYIFSKK